MTKGKTYALTKRRSLKSLYNYLKGNIDTEHLATEFSDSELALILDRKTGIRGYEEGTAMPNEYAFILRYFSIRDNAIETFSNPQAQNYDITRRLQTKVDKSIGSGRRYGRRGYEQLVLVEEEADMNGLRNFFEFLLAAFKEKLK